MEQLYAVAGASKYEFRMQIRRLSVWIIFLFFAFLLFTVFRWHWNLPIRTPVRVVVTQWTYFFNAFMPIGAGVLLADRLPRDRKTRVDEVLNTLPGHIWARLTGKYLGGTLATLLPMFIVYAGGVIYILLRWQSAQVLPLSLAAFAVTVVPGTFFVGAFSIACTAMLWVPLYQFLFICYWFWGNVFSSSLGIPTLTPTLLTPIGGYMLEGFFGVQVPFVNHATVMQGVESIFLLLGVGAIAIVIVWCYLLLQRARQ